MTYTIDLSAELYGPTMDLYTTDRDPIPTPTSVITSCAAFCGIAYYDRRRATQDYIERVRAFFGTVPTLLSYDSLKAYPVDAFHAFSAHMEVDRIMRKIDIQAIVRSWEDHGWVFLHDDSMLSPQEWPTIKKRMIHDDPKIYTQVTQQPGGTRTQIVDRYATAYRITHAKTWNPTR